jgi:hypothetical protein
MKASLGGCVEKRVPFLSMMIVPGTVIDVTQLVSLDFQGLNWTSNFNRARTNCKNQGQ